jgi:hypothetical protein
VGVPASKPVEYATIPVNNDSDANRYTGFAVNGTELLQIVIGIEVVLVQRLLPNAWCRKNSCPWAFCRSAAQVG